MLRAVLVVLVSVSLREYQGGQVQSWQDFRRGSTTEADILRLYGEPAAVIIRFQGLADFQKWRSGRPGTKRPDYAYELEYNVISNSGIKHGPLGRAHEVTVALTADGKLWSTEWTYRGGFRDVGIGSGEKPTPITLEQIEQFLGAMLVITRSVVLVRSSPGPAGVDRGPAGVYSNRRYGAIFDVYYRGEGIDITVSTSDRKSLSFQ